MKSLVLALALLAAGGCSKKQEHKKTEKPVPTMSDTEIRRGQDACKIYVDRACACATSKPDLAKECELAKALPDALRIGLEVAASPDSKPDIVEQSYASVRKTVANCIDSTNKLTNAGCP
ncbi:MAG TPA: hypothetical protein VLB44_10255 [Kofleriaceae bacterium]|nr:hypothetical protein [Kofleriaceae bacterium]